MFCPNCGTKSVTGTLFCGECGTKMPVTSAPAQPTPPIPTPTPTPPVSVSPPPQPASPISPEPQMPESDIYDKITAPASDSKKTEFTEGVILTNLRALAQRFGVDEEMLNKVLSAYIDALRRLGIRYRLIDASSYRILNPEAKSTHQISLSPADGWVEHINLLADYYRFGRNSAKEETNYLFIIGDSSVVPMPVLPQYINDKDYSDTDIDSDIPYAYLLGERTYPLLRTAQLFEYEQYFHVGRLPLAIDAALDDLVGYLRRAARAAGAMRIDSVYGQTDRTWLGASVSVAEPLRRHKLHKGNSNLDERFYSRNLYVSPAVDTSVIDRVFDPHAGLYYFNLHGSDAPTACGFYASYNGSVCEAIVPEQLASAEIDNVMITEACYGAKFQDYGRSETMLLAAMGNKTLLCLGSSRIAWGASQSRMPEDLDNADRITNVYMEKLLEGYTAGEAFYLARQSFFDYNKGHFTPHQALTIVEFNLFGDPFFNIGERAEGAKSASREVKSLAKKGGVNAVVESKCVYGERANSLLEQVRSAVDANLMAIRAVVDKQLYEALGVAPRQLSTVLRLKYNNGDEFYTFNYVEKNASAKSFHTATTDLKGELKSIISTK